MERTWKTMYENVCGSRRLLEGNILNHTPFVEELARLVKAGDRVLEVGSGSGVMGWPLAQAGCKVVSLDNDRDILYMAGINIGLLDAGIELKEGDAFNLPFENDSFNLAYSEGLVEHYEDDEVRAILREQLRVSPVVVMGVPLLGCRDIAFGDERWLTADEWDAILTNFWIARSVVYNDGTRLVVTMTRGPADEKPD